MVVGLPPTRDDDTCFLHSCKLFTVPALIAEAAVETLNKVVLPRTARSDKECFDISLFQPAGC